MKYKAPRLSLLLPFRVEIVAATITAKRSITKENLLICLSTMLVFVFGVTGEIEDKLATAVDASEADLFDKLYLVSSPVYNTTPKMNP